MKYPPCKVCRHSKAKHSVIKALDYVKCSRRRKRVDSPHCLACWSFLVYGPSQDWEYDVEVGKVNNWHTYEADNLRFLEHKSRRYDETHKMRHEQQEVPGI